MATKMCWDDQTFKMQSVSGGADPLPGCLATNHGWAVERNLFPYLGNSKVMRCPVDKGKVSEHCHLHPSTTLLPSCWETRGFSYELNLGTPNGLLIPSTRKKNAGSIVGRPEGWMPDPSRFILFFEPPASPQVCHDSPPLFRPTWYQWHHNRGVTKFSDPRLAPPLFFSPILFLDGHVKLCNFTRSLSDDPYYPFEETKDWIWYKPVREEIDGPAVSRKMTEQPPSVRIEPLQSLAAFFASVNRLLTANGINHEQRKELISKTVAADCVDCGVQIHGDDLFALSETNGNSADNPKVKRMRLGDCARNRCTSRHYRVTFASAPQFDWPAILEKSCEPLRAASGLARGGSLADRQTHSADAVANNLANLGCSRRDGCDPDREAVVTLVAESRSSVSRRIFESISLPATM